MKLYIAAGQYVGTQAEAKQLDKQFEQVDVPTDKEGLIAYLNGMRSDPLWSVEGEDKDDQFEPVVTRNDPPVDAEPQDIDELWESLPLARQLHFAALACEEARSAIKPSGLRVVARQDVIRRLTDEGEETLIVDYAPAEDDELLA